ncbi:hypothetical protein L3X38_007173 [Prunus dulcis]|uniref:2-oxoglutarate and Fe(II)-dependent oxygenase superfamily protein n=1 Tax=Prunus dulcis TaxID=3755 RepID=A0AAD4ZTZ7_PRUDU|nr:hypothetical protein L3X38_007173 [Prunus dulcis]
MAGDVFQVWSNDRVRPCRHRVTLKENEVRYSFGLFSLHKGVIHVPDELLDKDHPLSRTFSLRLTDLGSGDFILSTSFDSDFHLSCLRIFASFVFRWSFVALDRAVWLVFSVLLSKGFLSNPYCYIKGAEVFKFQNILDSIRKGIESHRLAQGQDLHQREEKSLRHCKTELAQLNSMLFKTIQILLF